MNIMMNAVSGVVGVILMVTITTIISVLVGAMVFGFANTKEPHFVAFSLSKYGEEFRLTLSGGEVSAQSMNAGFSGILNCSETLAEKTLAEVLTFRHCQGIEFSWFASSTMEVKV